MASSRARKECLMCWLKAMAVSYDRQKTGDQSLESRLWLCYGYASQQHKVEKFERLRDVWASQM
jgi:hypothetical protein